MEKIVKCEKLDHFGRGIVYYNDKITFVDNLLPDEEAVIKIVKDKRKYSEAVVLDFKKTSDYRVKPLCPYMNCGCALKHLKYEEQLKFKVKKVSEILNKFAGVDIIISDIIYSSDINHYRNKISLKVDEYVGYCKNNSNEIITIDKCALASPLVNEVIKVLNTLDLSKVSSIVIKDFESLMVCIKGVMDTEPLEKVADVIYVNDELIYGSGYVYFTIKDLKFLVSKDSFFQVNKFLTEKLYDVVIKYCGIDKNKKVLDLYCGTGTITLLLSKYFNFVTGVEINEEAVICANKNKEINGVTNVEFILEDVSKVVNTLEADIIVVDPPRSGLTNEGILDIIKINSSKIVYISCDPVTLARDLKILNEFYEIKEVTLVDMFPNTYHVESVVLLERR